MWGGRFSIAWRSDCGVSPVRTNVRTDLGERLGQVLLHVIRQRLEGRDIDDLDLVPQLTVQSLAHQPVDRGEERGKRLARTGRRGNQHIAALLDYRPGAPLRLSRLGEAVGEPAFDDGMETRQRHRTRNIPETWLEENLVQRRTSERCDPLDRLTDLVVRRRRSSG